MSTHNTTPRVYAPSFLDYTLAGIVAAFCLGAFFGFFGFLVKALLTLP